MKAFENAFGSAHGQFVNRLIEQANLNPYYTLSQPEDVYMERGWLKQFTDTEPMSIRLHCTRRSDEEEALHDHPWENVSIIVAGSVIEVLPAEQDQPCREDPYRQVRYFRKPGDVIARKATDRHRLILPDGVDAVYSIFIMGPWEQTWGFHCPATNKKIPWRKFLNIPDEVVSASDAREQAAGAR